MTLVEIMVVVIIMSLIATAVGVAVIHYYRQAQDKQVATDAAAIAAAATMYRIDQEGCPGTEDLPLSVHGRSSDPWGRPFDIRCEAEEVYVTSAGRDGAFGTDDDVSSPDEHR